MGKSNIGWTETVWNPLTGCTKIRKGCAQCYAEIMSARLRAMGRPEYQDSVDDKGRWTGKITLVPDRLEEPLHWKKPRRVFVNSMSDLFHEDVPWAYIKQVFEVMTRANSHTFQVLTKRWDRCFTSLLMLGTLGMLEPADNIYIGFSVCDQADANEAFESLAAISAIGWNTWISYEPALESVNWIGYEFINWLVAGGESGKKRRTFDWRWGERAYEWASGHQIPFFMKQAGGLKPGLQGSIPDWLWAIKEYPEVGR